MPDTRVTCYIPQPELDWIDATAARFGKSRTEVIRTCVRQAREDLQMLDDLGLAPERIHQIFTIGERVREWFRRGYEEGEVFT